jgi:hypothetical protein
MIIEVERVPREEDSTPGGARARWADGARGSLRPLRAPRSGRGTDERSEESRIDARIKKAIEAAGGVYYKLEARGVRGWPDRFVGFPREGRAYFIELKARAGRLEVLQGKMIRRLNGCGMDVRIVRGWRDAQVFIAEVTGGDPYDV